MGDQHRAAAMNRTRARADYKQLLQFLKPILIRIASAEGGIRRCVTEGGHANPDLVAEIIATLKEDRANSYNPHDWQLEYKGALRRAWVEDVVVCVATSIAEDVSNNQSRN